MTQAELTGQQRGRILLLALEKHTADDIAREVDVPEMVVRGLCRDAGITLTEREEEPHDAGGS